MIFKFTSVKRMIFNLLQAKLWSSIYFTKQCFSIDKVMIFNLPCQPYDFQFTTVQVMILNLPVSNL